ncbi:ABC transporter substrate-binding protein [Cognatishimia maritima]|uniref:Multiple sugar transport system substrate-binding protein n=1 Tax=Cognatishimia maritima TaxID=870908 RepID=A0A1M5QJ60_9RHOB|nr:extracellular solute-binding protein [Cognatishimia maritima]SHH13830.1 multiple sugar transport system substrate-binding protein [Cognatishimia maritima]
MNLKGMTWDHPRGFDPVVAASNAYAATTDVQVSWDKRSLQAFADAPILDLAERYDFIVLDHPHVGQIAESGALLPLDSNIDAAASLGGSAESYVWNGQVWAYAIDAACQMAAYRPDLKAPLPKTWEAFLAPDAAKFRPLTPLLPVDAFDMFMTLVAGRGEEDMPLNTEKFVTDKNGLYALNILRALYNLGPDEQADMNPIAVLEAMSTTDDFACSPCLFGYVNYARPNFRDHQIAYFDLPLCEGYDRPRGILGGAGIGVSAKTKEPEAAKAFAKWITSAPVQSGLYLQNNGQPANRHTWIEQGSNPEVAGFFKGGFHTIDNAWTRPRDVWFLGFVDDVCEIFPSFFRKAIPAETFLGQINALFQKHVQKDT